MIGQGYYGTHTPGVIPRNILENPAWYTAYTPYQPEISQGRLEALVNFQTMICDLTGMAIANASMLDEATAAAEAMTLCLRMTKSKSVRFFVADDVFAQTLDVVRTRARPLGIEIVTGPADEAAAAGAFAVLLQYPGANGDVRDLRALTAAVHAAGGYVVVAADILALTLLCSARRMGRRRRRRLDAALRRADGLRRAARRLPRDARRVQALDARAPRRRHRRCGRRPGVPARAADARAAHPAREGDVEHLHGAGAARGDRGHVRRLSRAGGSHDDRAPRAPADGDPESGARARGIHGADTTAFFDTITVATGARTDEILARGVAAGINFRRVDDATLGISLDETTTRDDVERVWRAFAGADVDFTVAELDATVADALPAALAPHDAVPRASGVQPLPLRNGDAALPAPPRRSRHRARPLDDSARIVHDEAERDRRDDSGHVARIRRTCIRSRRRIRRPGYLELAADLERMLCAVTGYAAVSLQPNAGSQGEYAGLLAIEAWHESRGQGHRNVCLIPASAHGTNPASAQMAGLKVVVVACDRDGNVDLADLEAKAKAHARGSRGDHGHLPVDARRVRGRHPPDLRDRPRARRAGLRRRREPECAGRPRGAGRVRRRRLAPQPAQDVLHSARRRRPGRGPDRRRRASRAVPAGASVLPRGEARARDRRGRGRAVRQRVHPADLVDVHDDDGRRWPHRGDRERDPRGELRREAPRRRTIRCSIPGRAGSSRTNASSICGR